MERISFLLSVSETQKILNEALAIKFPGLNPEVRVYGECMVILDAVSYCGQAFAASGASGPILSPIEQKCIDRLRDINYSDQSTMIVWSKLIDLLESNRFIDAIRYWRELTKDGLKEAKEVMDHLRVLHPAIRNIS